MPVDAKDKAAILKVLNEAVSKAKGKDAFYFAFSPGGQGFAGLVVSRKAITKDDKDEAKEGGGGTPFIGRLVSDGKALAYVTKGGEANSNLNKLKAATKAAGCNAPVTASTEAGFKDVLDDTGGKPSVDLGPWKTARQKVVDHMNKLSAKIAETKHPEANSGIQEIKDFLKALHPSPEPHQLDALEQLIRKNELLAEAEELSGHLGMPIKIREPLEAALETLRK